MKKLLSITLLWLSALGMHAQQERPFQGYLYNDEYQVYLDINLYDHDILPQGIEVYGPLHGYLGSQRDCRLWLITDAVIDNERMARLTITDDYGSEDLTAQLHLNNDGTYTLKHLSGSALKIVVNRKWVKLPKTLVLNRKM